ncbi:MAG: hypothetical protein IT380_16600 [Myxococcales bacterium]|nr:hypothetical protein [Myxococcales bacterium]
MDESRRLTQEVDALAATVAELEGAVAQRERYRAALHEASVAIHKLRRHLPRDEGPLGGEAATEAWRVLVTGGALVPVIAGAWGLDQAVGGAAIVAALALLIWEAAG